MFLSRENNSKKMAEISKSETFSPDNARLLRLKNNLRNDICLYLLDASYLDPVEKKYTSTGRSYSVNYSCENDTNPLTLVAVRQNPGDTLSFSAATVKHTATSDNTISATYSRFVELDNPELFITYHEKHRMLFYMQKLAQSDPIIKLRQMLIELDREQRNEVLGAFDKFEALDSFLKAVDNGDADFVKTILNTPSHPVYKELIKPSSVRYTFFSFITFDFTPKAPNLTATYELLAELKFSKEMSHLDREITRQAKLTALESYKMVHQGF